MFEDIFIEDSYSCRKDKGTMYGVQRVSGFVRECSENYQKDCYILKLDIRGYFMNIDKTKLYNTLKSVLMEKASDVARYGELDVDFILYLIREVLGDDPTKNCHVRGLRSDWDGLPPSKSLFHSPENCGLPIGNLTSQLFSNVYLHRFDVFMKRELNLQYYGRYVDDFVVVHQDKEYLKAVKNKVTDFLQKELSLEIHPLKIYLQHYTKGVVFLGAVVKPGRIYIAKRTKHNLYCCLQHWNNFLKNNSDVITKHDLYNMRSSINSYLGVMRHYKTYNLRKKMLLQPSHNDGIFKYGYLDSLNVYRLKKRYIKVELYKFDEQFIE